MPSTGSTLTHEYARVCDHSLHQKQGADSPRQLQSLTRQRIRLSSCNGLTRLSTAGCPEREAPLTLVTAHTSTAWSRQHQRREHTLARMTRRRCLRSRNGDSAPTVPQRGHRITPSIPRTHVQADELTGTRLLALTRSWRNDAAGEEQQVETQWSANWLLRKVQTA